MRVFWTLVCLSVLYAIGLSTVTLAESTGLNLETAVSALILGGFVGALFTNLGSVISSHDEAEPVVRGIAGTLVAVVLLAIAIVPGISAEMLFRASSLGVLEMGSLVSVSGAIVATWAATDAVEDDERLYSLKVATIASLALPAGALIGVLV